MSYLSQAAGSTHAHILTVPIATIIGIPPATETVILLIFILGSQPQLNIILKNILLILINALSDLGSRFPNKSLNLLSLAWLGFLSFFDGLVEIASFVLLLG